MFVGYCWSQIRIEEVIVEFIKRSVLMQQIGKAQNKHIGKKKNSYTKNHWLRLINGFIKVTRFFKKINYKLDNILI